MHRVLVTGATGLLGSTLVPYLKSAGFEVLTSAVRSGEPSFHADLTDLRQATRLLHHARADIIINLTAATDVDQCEREPHYAFRLNVQSAHNLAAANSATEKPARFIHLSTDHVYDGAGPQTEDRVTIRNHYAMSKLAGEFAVLASSASVTVLRVNFIGRSNCAGRTSFSDWVVAALKQNSRIQVFQDVWFSPLRMVTISRAIERVLSSSQGDGHFGVFNLGAASAMSKAQFAYGLAAYLELDTAQMAKASIADAPNLSARPRLMAMDSTRFSNAFGIVLPTLEEELYALAREYQ